MLKVDRLTHFISPRTHMRLSGVYERNGSKYTEVAEKVRYRGRKGTYGQYPMTDAILKDDYPKGT